MSEKIKQDISIGKNLHRLREVLCPYARRHSRGVRGARWGNLSAVLSGALLCINKKFIWKR